MRSIGVYFVWKDSRPTASCYISHWACVSNFSYKILHSVLMWNNSISEKFHWTSVSLYLCICFYLRTRVQLRTHILQWLVCQYAGRYTMTPGCTQGDMPSCTHTWDEKVDCGENFWTPCILRKNYLLCKTSKASSTCIAYIDPLPLTLSYAYCPISINHINIPHISIALLHVLHSQNKICWIYCLVSSIIVLEK